MVSTCVLTQGDFAGVPFLASFPAEPITELVKLLSALLHYRLQRTLFLDGSAADDQTDIPALDTRPRLSAGPAHEPWHRRIGTKTDHPKPAIKLQRFTMAGSKPSISVASHKVFNYFPSRIIVV
jgi:hypothetical protein